MIDFNFLGDGKQSQPPSSFLSNSRDNLQQTLPRRSKRNSKKTASSNENLQVSKSLGQTHENKIEGGKKGKNKAAGNKNKNKNKNSFTKLPAYRPLQPPSLPPTTTEPRVPGIKDYVDMVMTDLSTRPFLWHFSSYGLTLNPTQSLPFSHLGTVELSAEELRLQVYAEAAATGGRIDNYVKVVGEIKEKAESVTKALIPNLERVVSETLKAHNIQLPSIASYQDTLRQTLQQRVGLLQASQSNYSLQQPLQQQPSIYAQDNSLNKTAPTQIPQQHEPLFQHPTIQYQPPLYQQQSPQQYQSNDIIPDDSFAFGMIPEIPPE